MTAKSETPKAAPKAPAAEDKAPTATASKARGVKPVVAVHRINGKILPGTIFTPESEKQRKELFDLDAVEEPSEADLALFEKIAASEGSTEAVDLG